MNDAEFAAAYERGYAATIRFLLSRGVSPDAARDVAQAGWARGWEKRAQLREPGKLTPWINRISLNLFRKQTRSPDAQRPEDIGCRPETNMTVIDVRAALGKSPRQDRELLQAYYVHGYTSAELGRQERCSPEAIRVRVLRARKRIVQTLSKEYRHPLPRSG